MDAGVIKGVPKPPSHLHPAVPVPANDEVAVAADRRIIVRCHELAIEDRLRRDLTRTHAQTPASVAAIRRAGCGPAPSRSNVNMSCTAAPGLGTSNAPGIHCEHWPRA